MLASSETIRHKWLLMTRCDALWVASQIARLAWPTWGPPGSFRPQVGPMLAPQTLLSELWAYCHQATINEHVSVLLLGRKGEHFRVEGSLIWWGLNKMSFCRRHFLILLVNANICILSEISLMFIQKNTIDNFLTITYCNNYIITLSLHYQDDFIASKLFSDTDGPCHELPY